MSKTDDFDQFLKCGFEKNNFTIADEGFTEKVISQLPARRIFTINRNFILYLSGLLAVLIFLISNGYKAIFDSVSDIFNNGFHSITLSLNSFFVIVVFITVSFIISRIEHDENLI
jgi:hypothetical protein